MTVLTVPPIDPTQVGSLKIKRAAMALIRVSLAGDGVPAPTMGDLARAVDAYEALAQMIIERGTTDDGSPVADAMAEMTADRFNELAFGLVTGGAVDPPSGMPSASGRAASRARRRPTGSKSS